ncbi:MAG TPA: bifunctional UDP-N-acetylmuramoyl-tripeptide:D-alanyl-D-alanine ligase/alanine racemase [Chitinophagaceae bacterium]|nr:bifunctional UDP-N-acetylmuramoyl-tripeptide:D-alanyl-D-alanine ligase/alanine racemase [Chitinophagaceae bacterium]
MSYTIDQIGQFVRGKILQQVSGDPVAYLLLDSRKLTYPASSIFIALVTDRRDGHQYIPDLYRRGVRNFIVSQPLAPEDFPLANFILVRDTMQALHLLTASHRQQFKIPVIGITGSNGKTVVKEWLFQLLQEDYNIVRSPKSYNSQIGVPLSVWLLSPSHTLAIFEAGISQPGEMVNLEKIIRPDIGIFTNIGQAHDEGFLNIRQKINEKLFLFTHSRVLIYCRDHSELNECVLQFHNQIRNPGNPDSLQLLSWSAKTAADLTVQTVEKAAGHTRIAATYRKEYLEIRIPFLDDGSIENAIHCWCLMLYLGISPSIIASRMEKLGRVAMRLELKAAINHCSLINDSYNSDLGSLTIALDFLQQQKQHPSRTLILSDILQSGKPDAELYGEVADLLQKKKVHRLVGIGPAISAQKALFENIGNTQASFYPGTMDFISRFSPDLFHEETILLKGARVFEFERISRLLEQKAHQTVLEINLTAITDNLIQYRMLLKPFTKIMVMVKAFSYGIGSFEIANLLQFQGVDYLAVAYADEGVELRKAGITLPIMIMNAEQEAFGAIISWKLEPEIYSLNQLARFLNEMKKSGETGFPVHLKLDTGMHRLGFDPSEISALSAMLQEAPQVRVASVFSHLAAAEDPEQDGFTAQQGNLFLQMSHMLAQGIGYSPIRHISNTSAMERYPDLLLDMVRLGIGIYGIDHARIMQDKLRNVSTLKTTVAQVKMVAAGETVGYGRQAKLQRDSRIATVGIGYADGYSRRLGNGTGHMLVQGAPAPVVGQVCMDMTMLDVTDIGEVKEGDEVLVFGEHLPLTQLADWAGTIPYELLTGISQRVKRVYYEE